MNFEETLVQEVDSSISVTDLDKALILCRDTEAAYEDAHAVSSARYKENQEAEKNLIDLMTRAGKDRWEINGVKGFSLRDSYKFRVPNSPENKEKFFNFLKSTELSDLLMQNSEQIFLNYATVNHNSLNSLMNSVTVSAAEQGVTLPETGVEEPILEKKLVSLRGKK